MLTLGGAWPVDEPYIGTSRLFTLTYFSFFLLNLPIRRCADKMLFYVKTGILDAFFTFVLLKLEEKKYSRNIINFGNIENHDYHDHIKNRHRDVFRPHDTLYRGL